jgi:hypothetical protein
MRETGHNLVTHPFTFSIRRLIVPQLLCCERPVTDLPVLYKMTLFIRERSKRGGRGRMTIELLTPFQGIASTQNEYYTSPSPLSTHLLLKRTPLNNLRWRNVQ